MENLDFSKAFQQGQVLNTKFGIRVLRSYQVGKLRLTSGRLVACDPLAFLLGTVPFATHFNPGLYPVILSVAYNENNEEPQLAYAMLRLDEQTPVRWEMATRPGESLSFLKEGEIFGYGVDSGIGCFMDEDAAEILVESTWEAETEEEELVTKLENLLDENISLGFLLANLIVDQTTGANIIAFTSGLGDGFYPSYFGYDAEDKIVNVITDFCFFNSAKITYSSYR
ncbi:MULTISPECIES: DUF4241 domain-containing protein [Cyanophyceae]|uniref:DUF4241 domain-containing protein n=1 Tax=Cyanophyceae TaxID=3028117 RepID=UPI001684E737|nr:DUF4241 domain-containing protein [Trichocoleus sp. FACHB-40]MBD2004244.1 DUF4241 domain-containing protein [Trichocoleus sp. FACHB-40]